MKPIHFIINPLAGTEEPIESTITEAFKNSELPYTIDVSDAPLDIFNLTKKAIRNCSMVAVYGGDGTVMEAARALYKTQIPLYIIPGGTANVMAKELKIPTKTEDALALLLSGSVETRSIDMGIVNNHPFLIRINLGILSDMVTETTPEMKEKWGQWAYGFTAFQTLRKEGILLKMEVDGERYHETITGLTITNAGNIGREGFSFLPGISIEDGWLDMISMNDSDILSLLKITGSIMLQTDNKLLHHRKAKQITIRADEEIHFLLDDKEQMAHELNISVSPASLFVIVPTNKTSDDAKD